MSLFKIKLRLKNNINLLYYIREDVQTNKFQQYVDKLFKGHWHPI